MCFWKHPESGHPCFTASHLWPRKQAFLREILQALRVNLSHQEIHEKFPNASLSGVVWFAFKKAGRISMENNGLFEITFSQRTLKRMSVDRWFCGKRKMVHEWHHRKRLDVIINKFPSKQLPFVAIETQIDNLEFPGKWLPRCCVTVTPGFTESLCKWRLLTIALRTSRRRVPCSTRR